MSSVYLLRGRSNILTAANNYIYRYPMNRMWTGLFPGRSGHAESAKGNHKSKQYPSLQKTLSRSSFELPSLQVHQLLEKRKYQKAVELLRELPHHSIQKCLESFPFNALNRAVPDSFPIWETLLSKLHNSEEGYIPHFPYAACDDLVIRVAQLLLVCERDQGKDYSHLQVQCRRVLKQVYMQYHEVLDHLTKENERISQALYTLGLHMPLGTDPTAIPLQKGIKGEVEASIIDFQDALGRIDELVGEEVLSLSQALVQDVVLPNNGNGYHVDFTLPRQLNQIQLQERLHLNQRLLHCIAPSRRKGNLSELMDMLKARILGDKEVLAIYASFRQRNEWILDSEFVEPWLRRYQQSIECSITILREIEDELAIKSPPVSPHRLPDSTHRSSPPRQLTIPPTASHSSITSSPEGTLPHLFGLQGMAEEVEEDSPRLTRQRSASAIESRIRPYTATLGAMSRSSLSIVDSVKPLNKGNSVSAQDIPYVVQSNSPLPPGPAAVTSHSGHTIAGVKKKFGLEPLRRSLRNSLRRLSGSTGSMNSKSKKRFSRTSSSGETDAGCSSSHLEDELDMTKDRLFDARETIQALRKRERELTDRY